MRTQSICLAFFIIQIWTSASAQLEKVTILTDPRIPQGSVLGIHVTPSTADGFNIDNHSRDALSRSTHPIREMSFPRSQMYVIDTAIVRKMDYYVEGEYFSGDTTRHLYSFNASGKMTSNVRQRQFADLWEDVARYTKTYDSSDNLVSELYEYVQDDKWISYDRYTYTYDAIGNMLTYAREYRSNGQWVTFWRYSYTYDVSSHRLTELLQSWGNNQWENLGRHTYTYDTHGNRLSSFSEKWTIAQWVNFRRESSTFDAVGNELTYLVEDWRNNQWMNIRRYSYTYDGSRNMLSFLDEAWSTGQWVNVSRSTYTYDVHEKLLSTLAQYWQTGQWFDNSRSTYTYDTNGMLVSTLIESARSFQWQNSERYSYEYDTQRNLTSVWHDRCFTSSWVPRNIMGSGDLFISSLTVTDSVGNSYTYQGYNFAFTRKLIVTGIASELGDIVVHYSLSQNYPNPFNPSTTIKFEVPRASLVRLSVYDLLGREVTVLVNERTEAGVHEVKFDGSNRASGVYFYRLQAGDFVQSKKLVVLK